ncbi:hypothetical protein PLESTB_001027300 [Pleodorina starrii]|uniref:Major facilitator superfamily (MFS) profile domain-containing protein n=1 Tax=Pleodorina starrii TaxID=330485 RepID=A0A9W6BPL2_9CHLO|nr:hypothetical protein PLESTM_001814800 [Pleodorina starrii]GLC55773.1 hypothetical protein PLESTB_001027300 [Pleodorina starrii]GLC68847.1 hypothetical protein PLESTF_000745000 [Pleodorina starrii]
MSVAAVIKQQSTFGSDLAFLQRRSLCPGSICWSATSKQQFSNALISSRSSGQLRGGHWRSHPCGPHGSRVRAGILARDGAATNGAVSAVVGPEIIILGLSPEALEVAGRATDGAPEPQPTPFSAPIGDDDEAESKGSTRPTILVTEKTLVAPDGLLPLPSEFRGEICGVVSLEAQADLSSARVLPDSVTASASSLAPATSPSSPAVGAAASVYVVAQAASPASGSVAAAAADGTPLDGSQSIAAHAGGIDGSSSKAAASAEQLQQPLLPTKPRKLWERLTTAVLSVQWGKMWALALLFVSYVHQATTGFALPAMLPMISNELHLTDMQGALLTTGYSYLYAVALVPIGLLADRVSRPRLLAAGLALWSVLTCTASGCRSFGELILARVGFAAAQGAQNPVCFSLIPELFPVNKSTALSLYNCAIYVGRALSFTAVLLARHLHDNDQAHLAARGGQRMETRLDHLDRADLHSLSIMHTAGDMAAATPDREFNFPLWEYGSELPDAAWRQVLRWIAIPGFLIGLAMMVTLQEPRQAALQPPATAPPPPAAVAAAAAPTAAGGAAPAALAAPPLAAAPAAKAEPTAAAEPAAAAPAAATATTAAGSAGGGIWALLRSPGFMSVTLAAAMNDVGSYALIAWQSTFYERVYGLESSSYAPVLAALLPIGGIIGGVGGGYLADRLSRTGRRAWVTAGATLAAAPCLAASCLAPTPELSYAALLVGFALSEMWRAPSAVMARGIAPPSMGSTASALYLCVRNLVGGMGPLLVAWLIGVCGLQWAMMVVPTMYFASGVIFAKAETLYDAEVAAKIKAGLL